ncbi:MAG: hypothetical protein LUD41_01835, partial [Phascolarctobacterium sp.]|nr:hypothetical protein [Phascolarctobacterium sp.]
ENYPVFFCPNFVFIKSKLKISDIFEIYLETFQKHLEKVLIGAFAACYIRQNYTDFFPNKK